jgi:hypothetical protein
VNARGVAVQLAGAHYENDYWAAVVLLHYMRDGDQKLPVKQLVEKYPHPRAQAAVRAAWK